MTRSEARAQSAANQPEAAAGTAAGPAADAASATPAPGDVQPTPRPPLRAPWLVRNPRKAAAGLALAVLAASPFAYRYLERNFGPDPLAGIKLEGVKLDAASGRIELPSPAPARPVEPNATSVRPAPAKPAAAAVPVEAAPRPPAPLAPAIAPRPAAALAPAPPVLAGGVTHTRAAAVAQPPAAAAPRPPPPGPAPGPGAARRHARRTEDRWPLHRGRRGAWPVQSERKRKGEMTCAPC
jgi:hypothetical protein